MTHAPCLKTMRLGILAMVMAGLAAMAAEAQTVPRPTFDLTQHPELYVNVMPADVSGDGAPDLVAGTRALTPQDPGDVVVAINRGDGTFRPPVPVDYRSLPLTTADFDRDGIVDIVILRGQSLEILGGNGNGTFEAARVIGDNNQIREPRVWASSADLDGDGNRDLIVPDFTGDMVLKIYPGLGTLAFGAPIVMPTTNTFLLSRLATGHFNADGRLDFAISDLCCEISVYINQGGFVFVRTDTAGGFNDVAATDLNADGRTDLVAVFGRYEFFSPGQPPGEVAVLLGNGDGTFRPAVRYGTGVRGGTSIAAGDFNSDGRVDVATGNRSVIQDDDLGVHLADSVSVLPGDGTGRLSSPATFALANIVQGQFNIGYDRSSPYWGANHLISAADLNRDARVDLTASPGATLLNRAPRANGVPVVFAGPDRTDYFAQTWIDLGADASDPDHDWLSYRWTDEAGQVISTEPYVRVFPPESVPRTYTVTVSDGRGGTASDAVTVRIALLDTDPYVAIERPGFRENLRAGVPFTIRWITVHDEAITRFDVSYSVDDGRTFALVPGCGSLGPAVRACTWSSPGPLTTRARVRVVAQAGGPWIAVSDRFVIQAEPLLPAGWSTADIGAVGAAGSAAVVGGVWTVRGSGADIWGVADEFRYAYVVGGSTFAFTARVARIDNLDRWVKAGIMVREDLSPGSRHVSLFATPRTDRGLALQSRLTPSGPSDSTAGPALAPPVWLRVGRAGDVVSAYYRVSPSQPWILIGRRTIPGLRNVLYVGLAVSSHIDGRLAAATFDNVAMAGGNPMTRSHDVGSVGLAGSTAFDGVVHELRGSGADIWGSVDAFRIAYHYGIYSPGSLQAISARVRSVQNTNAWAKAGVMFREVSGPGPTPLPDARHVMVVVTPGRGIAMQYRAATGGPSVQVAVRAGAAPALVSITRNGDTFTGWTSADGVTWEPLGQVTLPGIFAEPGLVVTSHTNSALALATFDDVRVVPF